MKNEKVGEFEFGAELGGVGGQGSGEGKRGRGKSGEKTDKNGDFPCFFGWAVVGLAYSRDGLCWDGEKSCGDAKKKNRTWMARMRWIGADKITKKLAEKILKEKPQKFTCLDTAFKNNDQLKTNTALQMEAENIEFKVI